MVQFYVFFVYWMTAKNLNTFQEKLRKKAVHYYNMRNHVIVPDKEFIYTAKQT